MTVLACSRATGPRKGFGFGSLPKPIAAAPQCGCRWIIDRNAFLFLEEGNSLSPGQTKRSSALRGESNQTGSNLLEQVDDRKESSVEQPELFKWKPPRIRKRKEPQEYKVVALRECPVPNAMRPCETPEQAAEYWHLHVTTTSVFDPERECFVVLLLNTRRRIKGHHFISIGTMDTLLVHPREIFRAACVVAASGLILMHNHPSGDPTPSDADIKVTRDLIRAGQMMRIEVHDHIIIGNPAHSSLRTLGYFCQ